MVYEITTYSLKKVYKSTLPDRIKRLNKIANKNRRLLIALGNLAGEYGFELDIKTQSECEEVSLALGLNTTATKL